MEEMKAEERRRAIAKTLTAEHPVSATALAGQFSVSRQIIVGDIALLRAAGANIVSTPRGYLVPREVGGNHGPASGRGLRPFRPGDGDRTAGHGGQRLHRH